MKVYEFLPFAGLGEINNLSYTLFGDSLYNLIGGTSGIIFIVIAGVVYVYAMYHAKKEESKAKKIELNFKKAELMNKERAGSDIVNSSTAQYFV